MERFLPRRCGRPFMPLCWSWSISLMTLMKCAAIPQSAPPSHIHVGGVISLEIAIHDGRAANAMA